MLGEKLKSLVLSNIIAIGADHGAVGAMQTKITAFAAAFGEQVDRGGFGAGPLLV